MPIALDEDNAELQRIEPVLTNLREACDGLKVDFYIIGALARDIHLKYINDVGEPRRTRDVDVAVAVEGWDSYDTLRNTLINDYDYTDRDQKQRICSPKGIRLDLIPFGGVETPTGKVRFPPDDWPEMTVLGLDEARNTTVSLTLKNEASIEVVSLPALGLLKLIAWDERPQERPQDAQDLCFILRHYFEVERETIVQEHGDLFDEDKFDRRLASARAYGREIATLLKENETLQDYVLRILERETDDVHQSNLADAMNAAGCHPQYDLRFESITALLTGVREGLAE